MSPPVHFKAWSDEQTEMVRKLWAEGKTAWQITDILGDRSYRSVKSKIERERMQRDPKRVLPPKGPKPPSETLDLVHRANEPAPRLRDDGAPITMLNAKANECRWMWDKKPSATSQLCGRRGQGSWCDYHRRRVYYLVQSG
jgi:hypothetical protein